MELTQRHAQALERIGCILDAGSFTETGSLMLDAPVVTGYGTIDMRPVYVYSQYGEVTMGHAEKVGKLYALAQKTGAAVVGIFDSEGVPLADGLQILHAYGSIFKTMGCFCGITLHIGIVYRDCVGLAGLLSAMCDFVLTPEDDLRELISYLPANNLSGAPFAAADYSAVMTGVDAQSDVHEIMDQIIDFNGFCEVNKNVGAGIITAFVRIGGMSAGLAVFDKEADEQAVEKCAGFVSFCDAFGLPFISLTGGGKLTDEAVSAATVRLIKTLTNATVPKISVIIRKTYGSAYLIFNSLSIGADMSFIWQDAALSAAEPEAVKLILGQEMESSPEYAAGLGLVNEIIEPCQTRYKLLYALSVLASKREAPLPKKHIV